MWRLFWTIQTLLRASDFCLAKMFISTWVFWLCLSTFSLSTFTLFAYVFLIINLKKRIFRCQILETRLSVFVQLLLNWLWRICFPSPCIVRANCSQSEIKRVLAPKLLSPCYERRLVHAFSCAYIELWMHLGSSESTQEARVILASSNSYIFLCPPNRPACIHA